MFLGGELEETSSSLDLPISGDLFQGLSRMFTTRSFVDPLATGLQKGSDGVCIHATDSREIGVFTRSPETCREGSPGPRLTLLGLAHSSHGL